MMSLGLSYVVATIVLVVVDMVWLATMVPRFYKPIMGEVALASVNIPPAIVFYLIYPVGLLIFAVTPALKAGSMTPALMYGAAFGFFTYATYNLTNYATVRGWNLPLTVVDIAWGTVLAGVTSAVTFWIVNKVTGV